MRTASGASAAGTPRAAFESSGWSKRRLSIATSMNLDPRYRGRRLGRPASSLN